VPCCRIVRSNIPGNHIIPPDLFQFMFC
jgi:hypothetical protein